MISAGTENVCSFGGSLVTPEVEHQYNMPEGMKYEHGKGLSTVHPGEPAPLDPGLPKALQADKL